MKNKISSIAAAAVAIIFSGEIRYTAQQENSFFGAMFYITFSTEKSSALKDIKVFEAEGGSTYLSIKESLVIRNRINEILGNIEEGEEDE
jgi:hypothetical protein